MMHTLSMAPRVRRRQARIAIFASPERQNLCQALLQWTRRSPDGFPANDLEKAEATSRSAAIRCWVCGADTLLHRESAEHGPARGLGALREAGAVPGRMI